MTMKARIATAAVAVALLAVTLVVWNSPTVNGIVDNASQAVGAEPSDAEIRLARENAALKEQLNTSQAQSDSLREVLGKEQSAREKGERERAARQAAGSGSGTSGSGGSKSSGSSKGTGASKGTATSGGSGATGAKAGGTGAAGSAGEESPDGGTGATNPTNPTTPAGPAEPEATKPDAPTKAELLDPATRYYGMYTAQAPFNWATYDDTATRVGRTPNLVGYFSGWDKPFRPDAVTRAWTRDALPMLTWESRPSAAANDVVEEPEYSLPTIIAGDHDAYLRQYARDIAALGLPLAIRLDHEMNGIWYPWSEQTGSGASINGNSPGEYAAMWQHVHDIFEQEGANAYVIWVWAPNIVNNLPSALQGADTLAGLYPGDAYVDWVGVSGYFRPPYKAANDASFAYTYDRTLNLLRDLTDKKILLAEVGASEIGGRKPAWVTSFFNAFGPGRNEDVIGFAWFNMAVTTYSGGELVTNDWRVESRDNSLQAFSTGVKAPEHRFGGAPLVPAADTAPATPTTEPAITAAPTPTPTPAPAPAPSPSATPSATPAPSATPTPEETP
ncbi:glycoside hydrolase family 26 protein [Cellulomonas hominis]